MMFHAKPNLFLACFFLLETADSPQISAEGQMLHYSGLEG